MTPPGKKLRIIVGGLVGQFPLGGVAWDYFHYLLGLHKLGHDVYYHEDTWVWPYNPVIGYSTNRPVYTLPFFRDFFHSYAPELAEKWHYVLCHETHYGMDKEAFAEVARTADIFLNVSGACFIPDELGEKCVKVFLDTDPGYNQMMLSEKFAWSPNVQRWAELVSSHDRHLTYAENIYGQDCLVPRLMYDWRPTRCVVTLPEWASVRDTPIAADAPMSTVMTWDWFRGAVIYQGIEYGTKAMEFAQFAALPGKTNVKLALAINGEKAPVQSVKQAGWKVLNAHDSTLTPRVYQRFIGQSAGEWSLAKNIYVATRSGWFSCRSACYLAAGRPAVIQETGWSKFVPSGSGVIAFSNEAEALAGLVDVHARPLEHRAAAYEIAREYLSPDRVLPDMIEAIYRLPGAGTQGAKRI